MGSDNINGSAPQSALNIYVNHLGNAVVKTQCSEKGHVSHVDRLFSKTESNVAATRNCGTEISPLV